MNNCRANILIAVICILLFIMGAGCVLAQGGNYSGVIWPTYHNDPQHTGQNKASNDIDNPASMNPIWVFPRSGGSAISDESNIVDNLDGTNFSAKGWLDGTGLAPEYQYGKDFYYRSAVNGSDPNVESLKRYATWRFPSDLARGYYQIKIWVPASYNTEHNATTKAKYTVYDDTGATTYKFDQTSGGYWKLLSNNKFQFMGSGDYKVVLTNVTEDSEEEITKENIIVAADAVQFVPSTGMEIYASPVTAEISWKTKWSFTDPDDGVTYTDDWSGDIPAVYIGTVESSVANTDEAPDTGSIYCINSITPTIKDINDKSDLNAYREANGLSKFLGTTLWRYPRLPENRYGMGSKNDIEGPIEGGVYASPTLAAYEVRPGENRLVCYVAAMDRQVYALDAMTGELIWKGPGVTVSEDASVTADSWNQAMPRDAFGGKFRWADCVSSGGTAKKIDWNFPDDKRRDGGEPNSGGWVYSVYAWIPALLGTDKERISDAQYTITYDGGTVANVKVDISDPANQGKWVQIGSSYFNVTNVSLTNATTNHADNAADYCVVADAVMIVPATVDSFTYSTPVWNEKSAGGGAIFAATASGRVLKMRLPASGAANNKIGGVQWIYPAVRTTSNISDGSQADKPSLGELSASPAFSQTSNGDCIFVPSNNGKIYCVKDNDGVPQELWVYPADSDAEDPAGFTSSPAIDKSTNQLLIGDTDGIFYSINTLTGAPYWQYPDANSTTLPPGAFRYSTPAIARDSKNYLRAWIASCDGRIYSFHIENPASGGNNRRIWVEYDGEGNLQGQHPSNSFWYSEPSTLVPIQGSLALDATQTGAMPRDPIMFVGDMADKGTLRWFNARTGSSSWQQDGVVYRGYRTEGMLFSSPNITNTTVVNASKSVSYVMIGCSDGRVYAFSHKDGAWGGKWAGGEWPFEGEPNDNTNKVEQLAPDTDIQFEVFEKDFYDASYAEDPEPLASPNYGMINRLSGWIVSSEMKRPTRLAANATDADIDTYLRDEAKKQRTSTSVFGGSKRVGTNIQPVYLEWGEKLYIILWNLPEKKFLWDTSPINFTFSNTSSGSSAGSINNALKVTIAATKDYTVLQEKELAPGAYDSLKYARDGKPVRRSYCLAQVEIRDDSKPLTPGPGWTLSVQVKKKKSDAKPVQMVDVTIPLAKLKSGSGYYEVVMLPDVENGPLVNPMEQFLGINNPLAIRDDKYAVNSLAWGSGYACNRDDAEAHFNGNNTTGAIGAKKMPTVNLNHFSINGNDNGVPHGTSSRQGKLGIMDRSAMRFSPAKRLTKFRINAQDLAWQGGVNAVRNSLVVNSASVGQMFPWEFGIGSADYPNILRQHEYFVKHSDDIDPSKSISSLPSILEDINNPGVYNAAKMQPDTVSVSAEVPRYQPANTTGGISNTRFGYSNIMYAYIDTNNNGVVDTGNVIRGRPSTNQEAYRQFRVGLRVPADPRIEVEEQLVDIGRGAHSMGVGDLLGFDAVNPSLEVQDKFKQITIKNNGNVNLFNVKVGKDPDAPLFMIRDGSRLDKGITGVTPYISGLRTCSSLDTNLTSIPYLDAIKADPFITSGLGYTLTKPKVGDPDPSTMSVPDKRKWDANYLNTKMDAEGLMGNALSAIGMNPANANSFLPLKTKVSVKIPITQPVGTYQAPYVPVWCDLNGNGAWDKADEPFASPTFQLKVTVKEKQMTDHRETDCLPAIDIPAPDNTFPNSGDATPAAYRDENTGNVFLFWSSDRLPSTHDTLTPDANMPWFIHRAALEWDAKNMDWKSANTKWWLTPTSASHLPDFGWPSSLLGAKDGASIMDWASGLKSVRHYSPFVADNPDVAKDAKSGRTWLAWTGYANVKNPDSTVNREYRLFYTDATGGNVTSSQTNINAIEQDPAMEKRYPYLSVFNNPRTNDGRMWMFWQGGEKGRWSIYYSTNDKAGFPSDGWAPSSILRTPDCLSTVSSPNAVHRIIGDTNISSARHLFDMVYAGTSKLSQTPDIMFTKYAAAVAGDAGAANAQPSQKAQPLPRVYREKLQRDAKYGFYTSQHLAWMRPSKQGLDKLKTSGLFTSAQVDMVLADHTGVLPHADFERWYDGVLGAIPAAGRAGLYDFYNMPHIWIELPENYNKLGNAEGDVISITDGVMPEMDDATGAWIYKYPETSDTNDPNYWRNEIIGEAIVDFSAGIVRIKNVLTEEKQSDGTIKSPMVCADYTPVTWRFTTDPAVNNSPRAFIERTQMNNITNPGMSSNVGPVDRLWVLWRKAGTGVQSSTIYWKTYRMCWDLTKSVDVNGDPVEPIKWGTNAPASITVNGALGAWEVDRTGTKIYFTEVDERYSSLVKSGSIPYMTSGSPAFVSVDGNGIPNVNPITIEFENISGKTQKVEAKEIYWQIESPEKSLFGYVPDSSVNEGSVYAFADIGDVDTKGTLMPFGASKIWVFWTSTRKGTSDLCWATLSPDFAAR